MVSGGEEEDAYYEEEEEETRLLNAEEATLIATTIMRAQCLRDLRKMLSIFTIFYMNFVCAHQRLGNNSQCWLKCL